MSPDVRDTRSTYGATNTRRAGSRYAGRLLSSALIASLVLASCAVPSHAWTSSSDEWDAHDWVLHQAVVVAEANGFRWVDMEVASAFACGSGLSEGPGSTCDPSGDSHADPGAQVGALFESAVAAYESRDFAEASEHAGRIAHLMTDLGDPYFAAGVSADDHRAETYDEIVSEQVREAWRRNGWIPKTLPPYIVDPERAAGALRDRSRGRLPSADETVSRHDAGSDLTYAEYRPMASGLADTVRMLAGVLAAVEIAAQPDIVDLARWSGGNRYETAAAVSREAFPEGSRSVVVASGENWPDALAAAPLAGVLDAPVLLTLPATLSPETRAEIGRLGATDVYVVGGTGAVGEGVASALASMGGARVTRLGGATRYETAVEIAMRVRSIDPHASSEVILSTGAEFADALAASQVAVREHAPILLVRPGLDPSVTLARARAVSGSRVLLVGGPGAVSAEIEAVLSGSLGAANVVRCGGETRYETAAQLFELAEGRAGASFSKVVVARGDLFPDALAAGAAMGRFEGGLALSTPQRLHPAASSLLAGGREGIVAVALVGGYGALAPWVEFDVQRACDPSPNVAPRRPRWMPPVTAYYTRIDDITSADVDFYYRERASTARVLEDSWPHDDEGIVMVSYGGGVPVYNPTTIANYAIGLHEQFLLTGSGHSRWLFLRQADWLRDEGMDSEGRFLFEFYEPGRGLANPWWSAMAQGQGISALVRAYSLTDDDSYLTAAERAFRPFLRPAPEGVVSGHDGELWLEEYPTQVPPTQVLNGAVFGMWGLWDLYRVTGRPDVKGVFDRAAATLSSHIDDYDQGGVVLYERRSGSWAGGPYTSLQSYQLETLTDITGDRAFADKADEWALMLPRPE